MEISEQGEPMNEESEYGSPEIKKLVWSGPLTETDEGREIHAVVGQQETGEFRSGVCDVYIERGPGNRASEVGANYKWHKILHGELEPAVRAAEGEVKRQQSYDKAEPDRIEGRKSGFLRSFMSKFKSKDDRIEPTFDRKQRSHR